MKTKTPILGALEVNFFSLMQLKHKTLVQLGECQPLLGITAKQEKSLLSRLSKKGYIVRLTRGYYLVPEKLPPGGRWQPDEYTIIHELMKILNAQYQICGPAAFNFYGLSEQIPNIIAIYNTKRSGTKIIGNLRFQFIKVPPSRIGSHNVIELPDGKNVVMSSLARTLMDAVYEWSRFNTIPTAYKWIENYINDTGTINELIQVTSQFTNIATKRRIGYTLERLNLKTKKIYFLQKQLKSTKGWVALDPTQKATGKTNDKWRIIDNVNEAF